MKNQDEPLFMFSALFYRIFQLITVVIIKVFSFKLTISGRQNISKEETYIVASNHIGHLDPYIISFILSRQPFYMARSNAFILRFLGGVNATDSLMTDNGYFAIREAMRRIARKRTIIFFPEGEQRKNGLPLKMKPGAAFLALKTKTKILPVKITGTDKAINFRTGCFKYGAKINISVGEPILFDESYYSKPIKIGCREATKLITQRISALD